MYQWTLQEIQNVYRMRLQGASYAGVARTMGISALEIETLMDVLSGTYNLQMLPEAHRHPIRVARLAIRRNREYLVSAPTKADLADAILFLRGLL